MPSDLNKYQSLREIELGVYLGEHPRMDRLVTLRTFPTDGGGTESLSKLIGIARRLSQVDHPNLAHLYDVEIDDRQITLVMECASGDSLRQIVHEDGPLDAYIAARYCRQVADAMEHAHGLRLAHGRLEPEQIHVSDRQAIKIVGLGACLGEPTSLEGAKFDVAADVAALGQLLKFCLAGDDCSSDGQSITEQPLEGGEETLELLRIARRAELRDGENAIGTAKEFKHALEKWIQRHSSARAIPWDAGVSAGDHHRDSPQTSPAEPGGGRRRLPLIIGGVALLCLLMAGLAYVLAPPPKTEQSARADRKARQSPAIGTRPVPKRRVLSNELPSLAEASVFHREKGPEREEVPKHPNEQVTETAGRLFAPLRAEENTADRKDAPGHQPLTSKSVDDPETVETRDEPVIQNPLRLLPEAAALPNVLHDTQISLGPLPLADNNVLAVGLLDGDMASENSQAFELVQEPDAATWTVRLISARPTDEPSLAIAEIWTTESELLFRWLAQAKADRRCNRLRNCLIELRCCGYGHTIRLRQPQVIGPLVVKLERNVLRVPVDWLPDRRQLQFQLLASTGDPALSELVVPASSGEITIGDDDAEPGVWINLAVRCRKTLEVTATPMIRIEPGKIQPMTRDTPDQLAALANNSRNQIVRLRQQLGQMRNGPQKSVLRARIRRHEASVQQFEKMGEARQAIQDRPIHFRLFHQVGPHQVELLRTSDDAVEAESTEER